MDIVIHFGAETCGVDLGETIDERGAFRQSGYTNWQLWNNEIFDWGEIVFDCFHAIGGCAHLGYSWLYDFDNGRQRVVKALKKRSGKQIALEVIPPLSQNTGIWGFGGTPSDMQWFLGQLGESWQILLDYTHFSVAINQCNVYNHGDKTQPWRNLEKTLEAYLALPHSDICHYSGYPPTDMLVDSHDYLLSAPHPAIKTALQGARVICLEFEFDDNSISARTIEQFRKMCDI